MEIRYDVQKSAKNKLQEKLAICGTFTYLFTIILHVVVSPVF